MQNKQPNLVVFDFFVPAYDEGGSAGDDKNTTLQKKFRLPLARMIIVGVIFWLHRCTRVQELVGFVLLLVARGKLKKSKPVLIKIILGEKFTLVYSR